MTVTALPPISVCLPVYNGENYVGQALDSILSQSWADFELLVVDNSSDDGTSDIIDSYAAVDARIRYQRNSSNVGLVGNINRCIALAQGDWIKFLFHDDLMRHDCLARFMAAARDGDQIICCHRGLIFEEDLDSGLRSYYQEHDKILSETFSLGDYLSASDVGRQALRHFLVNVFGEPIALFFRREVAIKFGGFNDTLPGWCDIEFALRVASNTGMRLLDENLVSFRAHGGSTTSAAVQSFGANYIQLIIWLHEMAFNRNYTHFREIARTCQPPMDLVVALRERIRMARDYIRKYAQWSQESSTEMSALLDAALAKLPGDWVGSDSSTLHRVVHRVRDLFR